MRQLYIFLILIALVACKKGKTPAPVLNPAKAVLVSPESNSTCTQGSILSATESTVTLTWNSSANTEMYDVYIKDLISGSTAVKSSSTPKLSVNLNQNTPYSWYVVSKSSKTANTAKSDTWKFYNAGPATSFYAPFPADFIMPTNAQSLNAVAGKVVLDWSGSDVDNDIAGYDVYLGTTVANMAIVKTNIAESIANDIAVANGTAYYWKVVTKDSKGNSSTSETFQFKIN